MHDDCFSYIIYFCDLLHFAKKNSIEFGVKLHTVYCINIS